MGDIKYEFASPGWFSALHAMLQLAVDQAGDLAGIEWSACEVFTNLPGHLPQGRDGSIAWHYYLHDGKLDFRFGESTDVKFRAVLDYDVAHELARIVVGGSAEAEARIQKLAMQAPADGKAEVAGSRDERPESLADFHDALAAVTA